ncbi:MAG TPA: hypothetical protein VMD74_05645 [Candidatus Methylomirabilis sp.]|nr:hypothetical protein [Candidatus Methylomirabilis sp.]
MAIRNKIIFGLAVCLLFFFGRQAWAADNLKSVEYFVYDSNAALSSPVNQNFSIYIGENIGAITGPIKSAAFKVHGTYTGGGTLNLTVDSGNSQTFILPSVSAPTYFELLYVDTAGIINPNSAGTFNYTLGMIPSGVTIYGAGATLALTYQYQPASCPEGTGQNIKTTKFYVYDSAAALSSTANQDFSVYIGDNISQITNPVKSAYFKVTGSYIGNGTLNLTLSSNNSRTFTLPSVSSPTYFEFFYADTSGVINPTSAGTYNYTLGLTPSGVTIYGAGVTLALTYQYVPPSCTGLPPTGELTSVVFDTTGTDNYKPAYNSLMWRGTFNSGNGRVRFQLATADNPGGPWNYFGSSDNGQTCNSGSWYDPGAPETPIEISCAPADHNNQRYFRYKVQLCSNDDCLTSGSISPQVDEVIINWSP